MNTLNYYAHAYVRPVGYALLMTGLAYAAHILGII